MYIPYLVVGNYISGVLHWATMKMIVMIIIIRKREHVMGRLVKVSYPHFWSLFPASTVSYATRWKSWRMRLVHSMVGNFGEVFSLVIW